MVTPIDKVLPSSSVQSTQGSNANKEEHSTSASGAQAHPAESFNDDHIVEHHTNKESARLRYAIERHVKEGPRQVQTEYRRVPSAAGFRPTQDDRHLREYFKAYLRKKQLEAIEEEINEQRQKTVMPIDEQPKQNRGKHAKFFAEQLALDLGELFDIIYFLENDSQEENAEYLLQKALIMLQSELHALIARSKPNQRVGSPYFFLWRFFQRFRNKRHWPRCIPPARAIRVADTPPEEDDEEDEREAKHDQEGWELFLAWIYEVPPIPDELLKKYQLSGHHS